jgi:hypothetical protein
VEEEETNRGEKIRLAEINVATILVNLHILLGCCIIFAQRPGQMKKLSILAIVLFFAFSVKAQTEVKIEDIAKHVGDSVTVCTKIYGGIYLDRSNGTPTLLNAGGAYPNAPLTIFMGADARAKFKEAPEVFFKDKEVCIYGKVILYKEKPEIIIYDEKQIVVAK